jgi:SSS family solute:Na+ symporter
MVLLGLLWIPFIGLLSDDRMYVYLQSVQAYVAPPIAAVFLFGIFWNRVNGKGAIAALITGLILGGFRFIVELEDKINPFSNKFLSLIANINFLHYAVFLFIISSTVLIGISFATSPPDLKQLVNLTYSEVEKTSIVKTRRYYINVFATVLLVITILILWWIFR